MDFVAKHEFLSMYLDYVENTESPRLFHLWSALSGMSACMGRRCFWERGIGQVYPNLFVVLVGQPATRKGTAINIMTRLLRETTNIKFAPNDTSGQRQGLIAAIADNGSDDQDNVIVEALQQIGKDNDTFEKLTAAQDKALDKLSELTIDMRDPYSMYAVASEMNSLIGENNTAMLTFLQEMYDGAPYEYRLKNTKNILKNALLSMLAGTTQGQIAIAMPPAAIGQGFTSRIIFVHSDGVQKRIADPTLKEEHANEIAAVYGYVFNNYEGAFKIDPAASKLLSDLYTRGIPLRDPRFLHYIDRRDTHLRKVCMALAASRLDKTVRTIDVEFADQLLLMTESAMPEALGEYGMNKLGAAKQKMLEYIKSVDGPIPNNALFGIMQRDMTQLDFKNSIVELCNAKKISLVTLPEVGQCVIATSDNKAKAAQHEIVKLKQLLA